MPYRAAAEPDRAQSVAFDDLLPETRAQLALASADMGARCLLRSRSRGLSPAWCWQIFFAIHCAIALEQFFEATARSPGGTLGDPTWGDLRQGAALCLLSLGVLGSLLAFRAYGRGAGLTLCPGVYLFARELVDTRKRRLRLVPTSTLLSASASDKSVVLLFRDGTRHVFPAPGVDPAALLRQIEQARAEAERAEAQGDHDALRSLDPLAAERPRWEQPPAPASASRWHRAVAASTAIAFGATGLLWVGQRAADIEHAVRGRNIAALRWLAAPGRLLSGWADRRWFEAALTHGDAIGLEGYVHHGARRVDFVRALEASLGDCSGSRQERCQAAMRALCASPFHRRETLERALWRIHDFPHFEHWCGTLFRRPSSAPSDPDLARKHVQQAVEQRDPQSLWELSTSGGLYYQPAVRAKAYQALVQLHEREKQALPQPATPTSRMIERLVDYLSRCDTDVMLEVGRNDLGDREGINEQRAYERWRPEAAWLLHRELSSRMFGPLLRLRKESTAKDFYRPRLRAQLNMRPTSDSPVASSTVKLTSITWELLLTECTWQIAFPEASTAEGATTTAEPRRWSETFHAPLPRARSLRHPLGALPSPDDFRWFDDLLEPR